MIPMSVVHFHCIAFPDGIETINFLVFSIKTKFRMRLEKFIKKLEYNLKNKKKQEKNNFKLENDPVKRPVQGDVDFVSVLTF